MEPVEAVEVESPTVVDAILILAAAVLTAGDTSHFDKATALRENLSRVTELFDSAGVA